MTTLFYKSKKYKHTLYTANQYKSYDFGLSTSIGLKLKLCGFGAHGFIRT